MKKILALTLLTLLTAIGARADVIWQETFNYSNGPTIFVSTNGNGSTTVSNWLVHSTSSVLDSVVNNRRLEVCTSSAFLGQTVTRTSDIHRNFATNSGSLYTNSQQIIYVSYTVNFTNLPTALGAYFAHFGVSSSTFQGKMWAQTNGTVLPSTFRLGVSMGSSPTAATKVYPVDLALNTDYQVVLGYNPTSGNPDLIDDSITLWINPVSPSDAPATTGDAFTPTAGNIVNAYDFRQASGFGAFLTVSNLVVATTYLEAFTNAANGGTNAKAPVIVTQPPAVTANFVNSSFFIYGIANGQGLGNMVYQWQVSASPANTSPANVTSGDISGTTTPEISFSSAQASDSGYYTLIATTPYGLSVTSSIAQVSVSAAPVPPTFTLQPGNQTVYVGQTVQLIASVSSPGNVYYTWFSNGIPVSSSGGPVGGPGNNGQQQDSGTTSTYTIVGIQTNNAATYRVSATNDVVTTIGPVSTNAVITVTNPPSVSILFLRQLVASQDPITYQATVDKKPYQVTGVITTYTNITSGNTMSYYLQDGTAGINIFATFGSTFRPAQGDIVTVIGVLSNFSSGLELAADTLASDPTTLLPFTSYTDVGTGSLPAPLVIPVTITNAGFLNMNTNIAGRYVQLTNVFFGANAGLVVSNGFIPVTNSAGQSINLWFSSQDLDTPQPLPAFAKSVTGVMFGSMNPSGSISAPNFAVAVTKFSDIVTNPPVVLPVPLTATFAGGNVTFNWTDATFALQTATNLLGTWSDIIGATDGFMTNVATTNGSTFFRLRHP